MNRIYKLKNRSAATRLRSGKRGAAATEAASLPEAKKPKVSHVMERVPYVLQDQI